MALAVISKLTLQKGWNTEKPNSQAVLDALWVIAEGSMVHRAQIEWQLPRLKSHFELLQRIGCITCVMTSYGRGLRIERIELVEHKVPDVSLEKPKLVRIPKKEDRPLVQTASLSGIVEPENGVWVKSQDAEGFARNVLAHIKTSKNKRTSLVFIDVPNLTGFRKGSLAERNGLSNMNTADEPRVRMMRTIDVRWRGLRDLIHEGPGGEVMPAVGAMQAFVQQYKGPKKNLDKFLVDGVENEMACAGFLLQEHSKDVDTRLITIMMDEVGDAIQECMEVWCVLVAGDVDYLEAFRRLRLRAQRHKVKFVIWVISWKLVLKKELKDSANHVTYIDDHLKALSPTAALSYFQEQQQVYVARK